MDLCKLFHGTLEGKERLLLLKREVRQLSIFAPRKSLCEIRVSHQFSVARPHLKCTFWQVTHFHVTFVGCSGETFSTIKKEKSVWRTTVGLKTETNDAN
jgi:hypothetical protein